MCNYKKKYNGNVKGYTEMMKTKLLDELMLATFIYNWAVMYNMNGQTS
jgi:hypothetical protein